MKIIFSDEFRKEFRRIKNKDTRLKIIKQIKKLSKNPKAGKPLQHDLKNYRCLRVRPYRIVYRMQKDCIIVNCFDHRKDIYS